jgi:DNA-binding NarL/FixJ family response regulator
MPTKILIYDDNEILRLSLVQLINMQSDFTVVAHFENVLHVMHDIQQYSPDVILMDIEMPVINGVEAVQKIREKYTELPIVMLTVFEDNENVYNAICAGASGYLLKNVEPAKIADGIRDVLNGGAAITPSIAKKILTLFAPKPTIQKKPDVELTNREIELLSSLVKGNSYKMIADELFISTETVRTHIKRIYKKLEVNNASGAVSKAINAGLV